MACIFVSYRRDDSADVAGRIRDRLVEQFGAAEVFTDVDSIPYGVDFRDHIDRRIAQCDVFLAIIGPGWLTVTNAEGRRCLDLAEDFVRLEVHSALARGIPVIPLLVRGAAMPTKDELPPAIGELAYRNGMPIRSDPDFHNDMDRLIAGVTEHLPETRTPTRVAAVGPGRMTRTVAGLTAGARAVSSRIAWLARAIVSLARAPLWRRRSVVQGLALGAVFVVGFLGWRLIGSDGIIPKSSTADDIDDRRLSQVVRDRIALPGEKKTFRFDAKAGDRITAVLDHRLGHAYLTLSDPQGSTLASRDAHQVNDLVIRNQELPLDGTYTLSVHASGANTGTYTLSYIRPGYDIITTQLNVSTPGKIEVPGKGYRHQFNAKAGDRITVVLDNSLGHAYLWLHGPDGTELAERNGHQVNDLVIANLELPAHGTYSLTVLAAGANTGSYSLTIVSPSYDRIETPINGVTRGAIRLPGKGYWHTFEASRGDRVTLVLDNSLGHAYLWLHAPDGTELARRDAHQVNDLVIRDQVLPADGRYTATVKARGANVGGYALSVVVND